MFRSGEFNDVTIARNGDTIRVRVSENPAIARIAFEGNKKITETQLKTLVRSKQDGPLSRALVHDDVERLIEAYRNSGRFDATVVPKTIPQSGGRVSLVFEIKEGDKTGLGQILFVGNTAFAADKLKAAIKSGETNLLSRLLDNDIYDPNKVDDDRDLLQKFYRAHGYADMRVLSAAPQYDAVKKSLTLTFTLDEGPRYRARRGDDRFRRARRRHRVAAAPAADARRRRLRRRRDRQERRRPGARSRRPRPALRRPSRRDHAPSRQPHHRSHLSHRAGTAGLCRAHRHPRQR